MRLPEGWTVHWTDELPEGMDGATRWADKTVWLSTDLEGEDLEFIVQHELQHVRRGPARGWSQEVEERLCDHLAWRSKGPAVVDKTTTANRACAEQLMGILPQQ